jgi:hypothetical protein
MIKDEPIIYLELNLITNPFIYFEDSLKLDHKLIKKIII